MKCFICFFRRIQEILPGRVKEWNETTCVANIKAEEKLEKLKKVQEVRNIRQLCLRFLKKQVLHKTNSDI